MKLGNFFDAAGTTTPVNPRPITIKLVCGEDVLPNGQQNPGGRLVSTSGPAALVMMGSKEILRSRVKARQLLSELVEPLSEEKLPPRTNDGDEVIAQMYQQLAQVVHEYDERTHEVGGPLFPSADAAMDLVTYEEANRIMREYNAYMNDEHPTEVDALTRSKSQSRSVRVAAGPPR